MKAKIGDICTLKSGTSLKEDILNESNGVPYIKVSDMNLVGNEKYIVRANSYVDESISEKMLFPKGTVLFPKRGGAIGTNKKRIASKAVCADLNTMGVIPSDKIRPLYLYYYFQNIDFGTLYNGSSVPQINNIDIAPMEINLIPLEEQDDIVALLEKTDEIARKRKEELQLLDDLIKARFVELFGDAIHNDKGWKTDTVEKLCKEIYGGGTPSKSHPEYYEDGNIPWVSSKDMKTDVLTDSQIKINQLGVDNSTARMVPVNSVIMVIRSGILKHTLPVAINAVPITVNQDLKVFIPNERLLTRFLAVQFKMHEKDILSGVRAVTADNIEFNSLKQRELIVPPIEIQQEYVTFLEQIDKSKVVVQKSLDQTQILFDSLMQKYFG